MADNLRPLAVVAPAALTPQVALAEMHRALAEPGGGQAPEGDTFPPPQALSSGEPR